MRSMSRLTFAFLTAAILIAGMLALSLLPTEAEAGKCHKYPWKCEPPPTATASPTPEPTAEPTPEPTEEPTETPTPAPTEEPTATPTATATPTQTPDEPRDSCFDHPTDPCTEPTPAPSPTPEPAGTPVPEPTVAHNPGPAPIIVPVATPEVVTPAVQLPPSGVLPGAPDTGSGGHFARQLEADGQAVYKPVPNSCYLSGTYPNWRLVCKAGGWLNR